MSTLTQQVARWFTGFGDALDRGDLADAMNMFGEDCYWRDMVSFTWNIITAEGQGDIKAMLAVTVPQAKPSRWEIEGEATDEGGVTEAWFTFETIVSRGKGHIRLKEGKCWTLFTSIVSLKGFEEKEGATREFGTQHGAFENRETWLERKTRDEQELGHTRQPYCVIVGGGQGGIGLAARLKRLEVPTIIIEKNERPGDSWRKRYKSLCLHDPVWYDHMPYLPFPDHWPVFCPKDKIGDWLEMYTKVMELNYWHSTTCQSAQYDQESQQWRVTVVRDGKTIVLQPKQLVLATGMSGMPNIPDIPGAKTFHGDQHHSSKHACGADYAGKKCIVVGTGNSGHDICGDLWEHGADVTMIQRSATHVSKSETLMKVLLGGLYSQSAVDAGMTTQKADLTFASIPYNLLGGFHTEAYEEITAIDAEFYKRLKGAGFLLDFGEDESGLFMKYLRRGSGYYIDVGASGLIIDGKIKLKSGVSIKQIKGQSVVLSDDSELPADLIIYATGYGSMNSWAAKLISQEVADKVGRCWGLGSDTMKDPGPWEGELRNMWKPTQQPALWFHGGNLHQSRHYSQYLSLQIKARMESVPTPVYGLSKVHHLS